MQTTISKNAHGSFPQAAPQCATCELVIVKSELVIVKSELVIVKSELVIVKSELVIGSVN